MYLFPKRSVFLFHHVRSRYSCWKSRYAQNLTKSIYTSCILVPYGQKSSKSIQISQILFFCIFNGRYSQNLSKSIWHVRMKTVWGLVLCATDLIMCATPFLAFLGTCIKQVPTVATGPLVCASPWSLYWFGVCNPLVTLLIWCVQNPDHLIDLVCAKPCSPYWFGVC